MTTPNPTAVRNPRESITQAAGSESGMKAIMNTIASRLTIWWDTP